MPDHISVGTVRDSLVVVLDEIMRRVNGYVLDDGTSLFETLATITAEEASIRVSSQSGTLAAQVNHTRFYMDAALAQEEGADWEGSWQVGAVSEAEWRALVAQLDASTERVRAFMTTFGDWSERHLGGAIALIVHSAYHLGEIRQGIGVIRDRP